MKGVKAARTCVCGKTAQRGFLDGVQARNFGLDTGKWPADALHWRRQPEQQQVLQVSDSTEEDIERHPKLKLEKETRR